MGFDLGIFENLLKTATQNEISDIHLRADEKPYFRNKGELVPVKLPPLQESELRNLCMEIIQDSEVRDNFEKIREYDGSYSCKDTCRIRYNIFKFQGKTGIIIRIIPNVVPTLESLEVSPFLAKISDAQRGLILISGATGSGKSSTLAAMIHHINSTRSDHILTIEDPVEFIHTPIKSRITQREIGTDTYDFKGALRAALRQDPDVILIGEMRDTETMSIALKAAETGHVVFGTVHTTNALTTIGRLIAMFPPEEQNNVRGRIADNLHAVISQRLLPTTLKGKGIIPAQEIMVNSPGVKECIIGKTPMSGIYTFIEAGFKSGESQSFDQHLHLLLKKKIITLEVAKSAATSPDNFEKNLIFTRD